MPARDAGGSFTLNNPDDRTPVNGMFTLGDGLLIVTEKCTYRMQLADQIEPDRKNPDLPHNIQQKIFDHGTKSELLCNTLLLAKVMFRKEFQPQLNIDRAMQLAFDALSELVAMHEAVQAFKSAEQAALEKAQHSPQQVRSLSIPSVGNIRTYCKTFMQKADHFAGALLSIVRLFYPEVRSPNWDDIHELARARYGEDDNFCKVMAQATPFLKLVRNARDCLEHLNEAVATTDFELQQDGTLAPPSIEIDFRETSHDRCPISRFMDETQKNLLTTFEMIIVHMCSKHVQPFAGMPIVVGLLSENYRVAWHVRFAYGMYYNGQFAPIG
jgi:hypothetical protein